MLVPLNSKKYPNLEAIVDDAFPLEFVYRPHKHRNTVYAIRSIKRNDCTRTTRALHLDVLQWAGVDIPKGFKADHCDGNGLNNRLGNLRVVTNRVNLQNRHHAKSSNYPGVSWHKRAGKWIARIVVEGKTIHLGYYTDEGLAAHAYYQACKLVFDGGRLGGKVA